MGWQREGTKPAALLLGVREAAKWQEADCDGGGGGGGGGSFQERPSVHLFGQSMAESTHDHTNKHFINTFPFPPH